MAKGKDAQIWYPDFIIGLMIFIITLATYYYYSSNAPSNDDSSLENILGDANTVSSYLAGPGYPLNWSSADVMILGLTDGSGRIVGSKLSSLDGLQYSGARSLLNTKFDFFLYFTDKSGCLIRFMSSGENYGFGHPDAELDEIGGSGSCAVSGAKSMVLNLSEIAPEKVVKVERLVILNSTVSRMVLHEWR
ncbi:hypothetical protein HYU10_00710 [Candidatus Woesearchaeota archaeon]|nr:hypothetical protein [Candidatus Woesearchaeota archaeon]MBI2130270.1 hypothetical protein [Candidatus Woesearchaeota archaeon]